MDRILVIGSSGLSGKDFIERYSDKYLIDEISRINVDTIIDLVKNNEYKAVVYCAMSREYKNPIMDEDVLKVQITQINDILKYSKRIENFILFSTGSVYEMKGEIIEIDSPFVSKKVNPYQASKLMSELLVKTYENKIDSINIVRPFYIFGSGQRNEMVFKTMLNKIVNDEEIVINNNGGMLFNPIHVEYCSRFIDDIIQKPKLGINEFILSGDETITLKEIIETLSKELGKTSTIKENGNPLVKCVANSNIEFGFKMDLSSKILEMIIDK